MNKLSPNLVNELESKTERAYACLKKAVKSKNLEDAKIAKLLYLEIFTLLPQPPYPSEMNRFVLQYVIGGYTSSFLCSGTDSKLAYQEIKPDYLAVVLNIETGPNSNLPSLVRILANQQQWPLLMMDMEYVRRVYKNK